MIIVYVALNADADKTIGVVVSNRPTARFLHERLIRTISDKGESGLESNPCLIERL